MAFRTYIRSLRVDNPSFIYILSRIDYATLFLAVVQNSQTNFATEKIILCYYIITQN